MRGMGWTVIISGTSEADEGYNFMALSPSQIISMELTEHAFSLDELDSPGKPAGNATKSPSAVSNT